MTGNLPAPWRRVLLPVLLLLLLAMATGRVQALPGDLTAEMDLAETSLEAGPQESPDTVLFHGNITFTQPFYQYASASISADVDRNWSVAVSPTTLNNRGAGTRPFTVSVEVPTSARGGEVASLEVTAEYSTRVGEPSVVWDTATVTVRSWTGYRVNLSRPAELVLAQGTSGVLRVPVRNVGNEPEYFSANVPYWYGLRPYGVTVGSPSSVLILPKVETDLEFPVSLGTAVVPRAYAFELELRAQSLKDGGEGATLNPRSVRAMLYVTGSPPPDDPYEGWVMGDPPQTLPGWTTVFGGQEVRQNPDVDPMGSNVVYDQASGDDRVIYLGEASGSGARRLTNAHVDHHPVFSPNGQMIAFSRMPDRIIVINLNGTELLEFGSALGPANITDWSPSGDSLLYDVLGDIYALDLRTNTSRMLAGEPVDQYGAVYSPDGSRVFYVSFEASGVAPEIWTMLSDGSTHRQLTFNERTEGTPSVSPNGRRVAFPLEEAQLTGDRVCVMNTDGTDVRFFTDRTREVYSVRWLPRGEAILAEVGLESSSPHDLQRVQYPWEDAGFPSDDGDGGGAGGQGGLWERLTDVFTLSVIVLLVLVVVGVAGAVGLWRGRMRARARSAERLREMTGRSKGSVAPVEKVTVVPEEDRFHW